MPEAQMSAAVYRLMTMQPMAQNILPTHRLAHSVKQITVIEHMQRVKIDRFSANQLIIKAVPVRHKACKRFGATYLFREGISIKSEEP